MTRRRNPPSNRPPGANRAHKDRDTIDSELRAARANRKADSQQKQALRRREWDEDAPDENEEDAEMFEEDAAAEESPGDEAQGTERPKK